jgi:hypothetical protein
MKFGLLSYGYSENIGDEIQSLAAAQFLPRVDTIVERDRLHWQADRGELFVILNGWFTRQRAWPPPPNLRPLFVSFYAHRQADLIRPEFSEYFKAHEPIGCRSPATAKAFMNIGVEAYFSGCLTLTLRLPKRERDGTIYAVDVEADLFEALVPGRVRQRCIHLTHDFPAVCSGTARKWMWGAHTFIFRVLNKLDHNRRLMPSTRYFFDLRRHEYRMLLAKETLDRYLAAGLVITSRLHVAMPCLALGTPVILLKKGISKDPRFEGLRDLVNYLDERSSSTAYDWNAYPPNPVGYVDYSEKLRRRCLTAVAEAGRASPANVPPRALTEMASK